MAWFVFGMVLLGMAFLARSLTPLRSILRTLGEGQLRTSWRWLGRLILAFLIGYAAFGAMRLGSPLTGVDLIVSVILAAGGAFVLIVTRLSDRTTKDVVRIAALERDVQRDPLTDLFNRRYLDTRLNDDVEAARLSHRPYATIIADLDHFKHVNDTYGHTIGDLVIRHVARLLAEQVRPHDTVIRYGGEEFLILAPDADRSALIELGERVRSAVHATAVPLPDGRTLSVTTSLGGAISMADEPAAQFLRRADMALYEAKRSGRNRLCVSGDGLGDTI